MDSEQEWTVDFSHKATRQVARLRKERPKIYARAAALAKEIEVKGPYRTNWDSYGPLSGQADTYHCHIKNGRPTYVACWRVEDKKVKIVEVYYVGTHEGSPY